MPERPRILLLRRPTEPDPYIAAFDDVGFDAWCVPVLDFEPAGHAALAEHLAEPERYSGLVLTSPRAAEGLAGQDVSAWQDKPVFVVGPATAARARRLGLQPRGEEAGSAEALAEVVIAGLPTKPLLFLCGDRRRDTLPGCLREADVPLEECVVYRTTGDASALEAALSVRPDWLVFFSPSGVEAALECDGISWNSLLLAAIGPTTAEALRESGRSPAAVAAAPTPEALVAAVTHAQRSADA